jgi:hypothetical protein
VKEGDDLISAVRYAYMMRRASIIPPDPSKSMLNPRRDFNWRAG